MSEPETALERARRERDAERAQAESLRQGELDKIRKMNLSTLDWDSLRPEEMAQILMLIPHRGKGGSTYFLNPQQALIFAMRARQLGLSPISSEIWFNPENYQSEPTVEGQRKILANRGIVTQPPRFEFLDDPHDHGCKCTLAVLTEGAWANAEYTAWLSVWRKPGPVWDTMPDHMLMMRSHGKCMELITGVGMSGAPPADEDAPEVSAMTVKPQQFEPAKVK